MLSRNTNIDGLRFLMALMVLGIHANIFYDIGAIASHFSKNGIFRVAVPVFFVINGYYLKWDSKSSGWLGRILLMYAFWMFVYFFIYCPPDFNLRSILGLIKIFILGYYHLWYLSALIVSILLIGFLDFLRAQKFFPLIFLLYFFGCAVQYLSYFEIIPVSVYWYRNALFDALPFIIIGVTLRDGRATWLASSMNGFCSLCFLFLEVFLSFQLGKPKDFDMYFSLLTLAPFIFLRVKNSAVNMYSGFDFKYASSMIYFLHPLMIFVVSKCHEGVNSLFRYFLVLSLCLIIVCVLYRCRHKMVMVY